MRLHGKFEMVDPEKIIIDRPARQRTEIDTSDLKESIAARGVYNPIIVDKDTMKIIAGERRLTCCLELGIKVPVRWVSDLDPVSAHIIELEENLKRKELNWRDEVKAIGDLHKLYKKLTPGWTQKDTARELGIDPYFFRVYPVYLELDNPVIAKADCVTAAYNILQRIAQREDTAIMNELLEDAPTAFNFDAPLEITAPPPTAEVQTSVAPVVAPAPVKSSSIVQQSFLDWAPKYSGPKFNLIHCDFPYGVNVFAGTALNSRDNQYNDDADTYWTLLSCFMDNLDNFLSHSGHVVFWYSIRYHAKTVEILSKKLKVNLYPFIWIKSDNNGILPDPKRGPRQIYETALLCYRGDRPIVRAISNAYSAPTQRDLHPSTKPEPVLNYLFGMLVDGTTKLLDPTCGSGTSLRSAENHGAEVVFGMDIDENYVKSANDALTQSRILRAASKKVGKHAAS